MSNPSPDRGSSESPQGRKGVPCHDPIQLADATTAKLQERLDAITTVWCEGDLEMLRLMAAQLAGAAVEHESELVRRSGEELGALANHDEANASLIAEKIEQVIRLCRCST